MTSPDPSDQPTGADVARAAAWSIDSLRRAGGDWNASIPGMDWTVSGAVTHTASGCLWYAIDLAAGGTDLTLVDTIKPGSAPEDLLATLDTYATLLAAVVETSPSTRRGFHPYGPADPGGFAAMGCDEILVHTDDVLRGLGQVADPPADLCAVTLRRLFPWAPDGADPWPDLLWANGRIDRPGRPRLRRWIWHCKPLSQWDGSQPTEVH
jgi:Mycothiol maleylpyruvate isomerase N-terminal domain